MVTLLLGPSSVDTRQLKLSVHWEESCRRLPNKRLRMVKQARLGCRELYVRPRSSTSRWVTQPLLLFPDPVSSSRK